MKLAPLRRFSFITHRRYVLNCSTMSVIIESAAWQVEVDKTLIRHGGKFDDETP